ncbi:MAG: NAD-dependent epimerase/dehydratase family protein [Cyanobacteriota bacterium]
MAASSPSPSPGRLAGRRVAVTGASGRLGQALLRQLHREGASLVALTSSDHPLELRQISGELIPLEQVPWRCGEEDALRSLLADCDILILNHGINVHGDGSAAAVQRSLEVNALSSWRLLELFAASVTPPRPWRREVWVNTSEAEIQPAFSPLYEISKRLLGELVSLRAPALEHPAIAGGEQAATGIRVRRLVLGPFRSDLNPVGVMNADWVAKAVLSQALLGLGLIIVTPNPITYLVMPLVTLGRWLYGRLLLKRQGPEATLNPDR